jgi:DNA replication protein DnaD
MVDYAKIPADVIAMIIEYCISIDKTSFRFIEKTAYDWFDSGIDTHKKVEAHITLLQNQKKMPSQFLRNPLILPLRQR